MPASGHELTTRAELRFGGGPLDILGQLDAEYRSTRVVPPGEALHLFLLGVADRVGGRGVGQQLVVACLEHGARRGYRLAVTEATNRVSQHIFRKLGFVERVQRSFQAHRFGGRAVFASIAERGGPILMDRSIQGRTTGSFAGQPG